MKQVWSLGVFLCTYYSLIARNEVNFTNKKNKKTLYFQGQPRLLICFARHMQYDMYLFNELPIIIR